jgi:PAS domain S-box-containing protein
VVKALLAGQKPNLPQRVLIVEDDQEMARLLQKIFAKHGYLTMIAQTNAEARARFIQQPADVVVLDYHLPDENAEALLAEFAPVGSSTAIVVITGDPDPNLTIRALRKGADAFLHKPFKPEQVVEVARKAHRERALIRAEELLVQRTQQLQLTQYAMDHVGEAVFWIQPDGRFIYANDAACQMLKRTRDEALTLHLYDVVLDLSSARWAESWAHIREHNIHAFAAEFHPQNGRPFPVEISAHYLQVKGQEYAFAFVRDITERRRLEEQLLQANKMESIGRLAGGIAHDFNNILQSILGFSELLGASFAPDDLRLRDLGEIKTAAQRAARLTSELLAYSQKQLIEVRVVDLNLLLTGMQTPLRGLLGADCGLNLVLAPGLARASVDPAQIERVIMTMAQNARDAMTHGGQLTISTENITLQPGDIGLIAEGRHGHFVRIALSDTGRGMAPNVQQHIFEPFFSTKGLGKGTGLGLAMAYGIIKQHKGWINVYSEPDHGTTFKIYLPTCEAHAVVAPAPAAPPGPHNKRILLVEDEPSISEFSARALTRHGYEVQTTTSAQEALQLAARDTADYALLFSDIVLADGNGIELANQLRQRFPALRVMLTSGYTDNQIRWPEIGRQGYRFLPKPYPAAALLKAINELFADKNP